MVVYTHRRHAESAEVLTPAGSTSERVGRVSAAGLPAGRPYTRRALRGVTFPVESPAFRGTGTPLITLEAALPIFTPLLVLQAL